MSILEVKTRVLPGGGIKFEHPALPEGAEVTVTVQVAEGDEPPHKKKSFLENLGGYQGGQSFKSIEEVDRYLKEERDSWDG
jgi:hypothetical protein